MANIENKKILVAGCGGLGCYIVENLIRMKAGSITVCDADTFAEGNLNRQLYASFETLGKLKVFCAEKHAKELKYKGIFKAIPSFITPNNVDELVSDADIVIDALDNSNSRFVLEDACTKHNVPLVHGAVGEWHYQVALVMPGSNIMHNLYQSQIIKNKIPTHCFTVEACAATETAEALKYFEGIKSELENSLMLCDLKNNTQEIIKFYAYL